MSESDKRPETLEERRAACLKRKKREAWKRRLAFSGTRPVKMWGGKRDFGE